MMKQKLAGGDEYDALTGWRRALHFRAGERARIKRKARRRLRRQLKREVADARA